MLFLLHLVSEWLLSAVTQAVSELCPVFPQCLNCILLMILSHGVWCVICPCRLTSVSICIPLVWWYPVLQAKGGKGEAKSAALPSCVTRLMGVNLLAPVKLL